MSYPNVIYGAYGDEKVTAASAIGGLPLGQLMILPDGRKFRHAQAGAAALSAGSLVSNSAGLAGNGNVASSGLIASATTTYNLAGHTDVYLAMSLAAATLDQFADGYLNVIGPAASAYIGSVYKIKGNTAAASVGGVTKVTLYQNDPLKVSFAAGSTRCSLRKSAFKDIIPNDGATVIAPTMGVAPVAVSATYFCWVQRTGECSIRQAATVAVDGQAIIASSVEAGSITVALSAAAALTISINHHLGFALEGAAASQAVLCYLTLE